MTKIEKLIEYRKKIEKVQDEFNEAFPGDFEAQNALTKASTHLSQAQIEMTMAEGDFVLADYFEKKENDESN